MIITGAAEEIRDIEFNSEKKRNPNVIPDDHLNQSYDGTSCINGSNASLTSNESLHIGQLFVSGDKLVGDIRVDNSTLAHTPRPPIRPHGKAPLLRQPKHRKLPLKALQVALDPLKGSHPDKFNSEQEEYQPQPSDQAVNHHIGNNSSYSTLLITSSICILYM